MAVWLIGPFLVVLALMLLSWWRAARQGSRLRVARMNGARSEAALSDAMAEAVTRLRGQELAHRARVDTLEAFITQLAEALPAGLIVVSPEGHIRLLNKWATEWLRVPEPATGRVLWQVEGTDALRDLGHACLTARARRDGIVAGPDADRASYPVATIPLTSATGDIDGLLYLIDHEKVS
jgi:hypothetical protein